MTFELTDSLADDILFAMEDQQNARVVDAEHGTVVSSESVKVDEVNFYALPVWSSGDGYSVLQEFTNNLHAPLAREELRRVLTGGRGVFRKFKDVIKSYPEVERKWHFFKNARMKKRLNEWYGSLRESWGLEQLEYSEDECIDETEELVRSDFIFNTYNSDRDRNCISHGCELIREEYRSQYPFEVGDAVGFLWQRLSSFADSDQKSGFVCYTQSEEFTGCLLFSYYSSSSKKTAVITDFFVVQNYRGLGIGKELLGKCLDELRSHGIQWVLVFNAVITDAMESLLNQNGFTKLGSGYLADLLKDSD